MHQSWQRTLAFVVAVICIGFGAATVRKSAEKQRDPKALEESLIYLPPPERLRGMSLGYSETLSDLIWLRAVIFTGTVKNGQKLDWIARYVQTINFLNPKFRRPYLWGAVVTIYNGKEIDRSMLDQSVAILREGIERFPEDHELLFNLGMILYRDYGSLGTLDPELVESYKKEGAQLIRKAAAFGASPLIRQLAASLEVEGNDRALEVEFLEHQLLRAEDEGLRRLLRKKLGEALSEQGLKSIEARRKAFLEAHQQQFPYLPAPVFALLQDGKS